MKLDRLSAAGAALRRRRRLPERECWRAAKASTASEFAYGDDPYQRLAVFPAPKPSGRVLLFWHGGGWTAATRNGWSFMAPALRRSGVTFVTAGYRLAPQHVFPAGLDECADAVAWVHATSAQNGGDAGRIFVGGHSAGGHYAALLAACTTIGGAARLARRRRARLPADLGRLSVRRRLGPLDAAALPRPRRRGQLRVAAAKPATRIEPGACRPS